jgi:hypothetical protein
MVRSNSAEKEFMDTIHQAEDKIQESTTPDKDGKISALRTAVRYAKLVKHPENLPKALITAGLMKESSAIREDINPINLRNFLLENHGTDWLDWLPEVTDKTLFDGTYNAVISNKIQALRISITTDSPWLEWNLFENVGQSFNHDVPIFDLFQPLSIGECNTTMWTLSQIQDESFSPEVLLYVANIAFHDNYVYLPEEFPISKAQPYLAKLAHDKDLINKVKIAWESASKHDLLAADYKDDDVIHRQLAKLALVKQYYIEFQE